MVTASLYIALFFGVAWVLEHKDVPVTWAHARTAVVAPTLFTLRAARRMVRVLPLAAAIQFGWLLLAGLESIQSR